MENGTFVSDDEITHMLNDSIADIYAQMINIDEGQLFATVSPTLVQIGNNAYQLPADFHRLVDVNVYTGSRWVPAFRADPQDYMQLFTRQYDGDFAVEYYLHLNADQGRYELFLFPEKDVNNIGVRYLKPPPVLSVGTDELKWPSNWHQAPVVDTAIKMLVKEESDPSGLIIERDRTLARVLKDIRSQAVAEVMTIRNSSSRLRSRRSQRFNLPII